MPIYEFKCKECNNMFSELRKIGKFSNVKCPKCKSRKVKKIISQFAGKRSCSGCTPLPAGGG